MSDRIVLGSGKLYITSVTATAGVYTVPTDNVIETDANLLGYIQGGATLEYTPTFYTVKDDLNLVSKRFLTNEEVIFKSGILTWNGKTLDKLCSTGVVTETTGKRTVKIGGLGNYDDQMYLLRFVHVEEGTTDLDTRITVVGSNTAGFELQFNPDTETVVNAEFECVPGVGAAGILVIYEEEDSSIV